MHLQKHAAWVLNVLLDLDQEGNGLTAIEETMIVGESEIHHLRAWLKNYP